MTAIYILPRACYDCRMTARRIGRSRRESKGTFFPREVAGVLTGRSLLEEGLVVSVTQLMAVVLDVT